MATFGTTDDEQDLATIRAALLSGDHAKKPPPPPPVVVAPPSPPVQEKEPETVGADEVDTESVNTGWEEPAIPVGLPAASPPPRPSFTAIRPRNISQTPSAAPADADIDGDAEVWSPRVVEPVPAPITEPVAVVSPPPVVAAPPVAPAPAPVAPPQVADPVADASPAMSVEQVMRILQQNPEVFAAIQTQAAAGAHGQIADPATVVQAAVTPAAATEEPVVDVDTSLARADLATYGWRAWLVKFGIPVRKSSAERFNDLMDYARDVVRRDLGRPLVIGVTSYRGSCGKTSATVVLSRLLAEIRGEDVLALDTDLHGTLLSRASTNGVEPVSTMSTMGVLADQLRGGGDIKDRVWNGGGGFAFVPGSRTNKANAVTTGEYRAILAAARQIYSIVVVDMSALMDTELYRAALSSLDGLVMMAPTVEDGVQTLYETQTDLHSRGVNELNGHRITVLNNTIPTRTAVDTEEFARGLKHRDQRDVVEIPYDRHLALSKQIDIAQLSPQVKSAFTLTLAALIDTFDVNESA